MLSKFTFPLNSGNFYILLWSLYFMQGILYPQGCFISQAILAIILLISFYNMFYINIKYKLPTYFKGLNILLLMFIIYGVILIVSGEKIYKGNVLISNINYIKEIIISILPIYSFYNFSIKNKITEKNIRIWSILFILVAICRYWFNYQKLTEDIVVYGSQQIEITNNIGYSFLAILPLAFFWYKKPIIQYIIVGLIMFFILSAMKRGAIMIGSVCMVWFLYQTLKTSSRNRKILIILLCLAIILFAVNYIENMIATSDYFNRRIEDTLEGKSSGRDSIYTYFINYFLYKASVIDFLIGGGANATLSIYEHLAHNDWIEIAINQGCIGIIIYLIYWSGFWKSIQKTNKTSIIYSCLITIFIIFFAKTFFSMSYGGMSYMTTLPLGYCLANSQMSSNDPVKTRLQILSASR